MTIASNVFEHPVLGERILVLKSAEEYLETFYALAQAGQVSPQTGLPGIIQWAVLLNEYRDEIQLVGMAEPIQSSLFVVLAAVGKLLGCHRALQHLSYA